MYLLPYATRETLEELGLVGYQVDTFSSDYDDDHIDESGMVYSAGQARWFGVCGSLSLKFDHFWIGSSKCVNSDGGHCSP